MALGLAAEKTIYKCTDRFFLISSWLGLAFASRPHRPLEACFITAAAAPKAIFSSLAATESICARLRRGSTYLRARYYLPFLRLQYPALYLCSVQQNTLATLGLHFCLPVPWVSVSVSRPRRPQMRRAMRRRPRLHLFNPRGTHSRSTLYHHHQRLAQVPSASHCLPNHDMSSRATGYEESKSSHPIFLQSVILIWCAGMSNHGRAMCDSLAPSTATGSCTVAWSSRWVSAVTWSMMA